MRPLFIAVLASAAVAGTGRAQGALPSDSILRRRTTEVASKFEEFSGRRGALFTRTVEKIGEIRAESFRDFTVSVTRVTDAGPGGGSASALALGRRYGRLEAPTMVGLVDPDEVDSFVAAVALMEKRAPELAAAKNATDAVYTARTGLQVYVTGQGEAQRFYIASPHYGVDPYDFEIHDLPRLRALLDTAVTRLKAGSSSAGRQ